MITVDFARQFAAAWIDAWNSHDLERILSHYSDDFAIETPMALKVVPHSKGLIEGKNEVRQYWKLGLERIPNLRFELLDVLTGINGLTIYYINKATQKRSVEIMSFDIHQKVNKAIVNYSE